MVALSDESVEIVSDAPSALNTVTFMPCERPVDADARYVPLFHALMVPDPVGLGEYRSGRYVPSADLLDFVPTFRAGDCFVGRVSSAVARHNRRGVAAPSKIGPRPAVGFVVEHVVVEFSEPLLGRVHAYA